MFKLAQRITDSALFESTVVGFILTNAVVMGAETIDTFNREWEVQLYAFYVVSQVFFVLEITLRMIADGPRDYLRDPWNRFDFTVVALSLLPGIGAVAPLARIVRVLRVLRLFSTLDPLRDTIERDGVLGRVTVPVLTMIAVLGYTFAIAGNALFGAFDPGRWGGLFEALRTVLYLALLTDVDGAVGAATAQAPAALLFFALFYAALLSVALQAIAMATRREAT